jgi:hypothetical protein
MAMSSKRLCAMFAMVPMLAMCACTTANKHIGEEDQAFGEAVKYNAALQTINPVPVYPEDGAEPGSSGAKGAAAVKHYRNDEVNARHKAEASTASSGLSTTQGTSGGGGPH